MKRAASWRWLAMLAMLMMVGASPAAAVAQQVPDLQMACNGNGELPAGPSELRAGPSPETEVEQRSWEYRPAVDGGFPRLACASQAIASLLGESHGDWGIAVRDLRTRETLLVNPDRHFVAGSLYKLGVAAEAYARIDAGSLTPESLVLVSEQDVDPGYGGSAYDAGTSLSVRQAVQAMLTQSDNGAALALVDRLGLNAVNLRFGLLGMPDTRLIYDAVTTPRDVLAYFTSLADGDVVSPDASARLVQLLAAQEINDRIPAGLPAGGDWLVAHKTANIDDMVGDAGIIYAPNHDAYVLIVLNQGLSSYWTSVQIIRAISQAVYTAIMAPDPDTQLIDYLVP